MKPLGPQGPTYKRDVIERFLCVYHGVTDLSKMTPFGQRVSCWQVMRPVTLTVETQVPKGHVFQLKGPAEAQKVSVHLNEAKRLDSHLPTPKLAFKKPGTQDPMEVDLDRVYPFSVITRHVRSNVPIPVAIRLNFYHQHLNVLEKQEEHDELLAIGGAIKGAFTSVSATPPYGEDVEVASLKRRQFSYCNEFFVSTMALINEDNLYHGIVKIPPDVCKTAGLRIFEGIPEPPDDWVIADALEMMDISKDERSAQFKAKWVEEAEKQKMFAISHYYAVPINHVLAWGLQTKEYAAAHKVDREEFYFTPPPTQGGGGGVKPKGFLGAGDILLYYLVSDVSMKAMREDFDKHWVGKTDQRSLNSMGFDMIPMTGAKRYPGLPQDTESVTVDTLVVRSTFSYMVAPKLSRAQVANLAPTLSPTFPSCRDWDPAEAARQRELEKYIK